MADFSINKSGVLTKYRGTGGDVIIPDGVVKIDTEAFWGSTITSVVIPETVSKIGCRAFMCCRSLTEIVIPNGVKTIEWSTFEECDSLKKVVLPESITKIGHGAFSMCYNLVDINIPSNVKEIQFHAFMLCKSLSSISLPDSLKTIGFSVFYDCNNLESIEIPQSLKEIPGSIFGNCTKLNKLTIPDGVTKIGGNAFANCPAEIQLPRAINMSDKKNPEDCEFLRDICLCGKDSARILLYQSGKKWEEFIKSIKMVPQGTAESLCIELKSIDKVSKAQGTTAAGFVIREFAYIDPATIRELYGILVKKNKASAALLADDPHTGVLLNASSEGNKAKNTQDAPKSQFEYENDLLIRVNGKGKALNLPDNAKLAPDALKDAQYTSVKISQKNTGITPEWLHHGQLSNTISEVSIPLKTLLGIMEDKADLHPFSDDILAKLKITGATNPSAADLKKLIAIMIDCLQTPAHDVYDRFRDKLNMEDSFNLLSGYVSAFPCEGITSCREIVELKIPADEQIYIERILDALARLREYRYADARAQKMQRPIGIQTADGTGMVPENVCVWLFTELARCRNIENGAKNILRLIDETSLMEYLSKLYVLDSHDPQTVNIAPVIWILGQIGNEKLVSKLVTDLKEIMNRGYLWFPSTNRDFMGICLRDSIALNNRKEVLLMLDKRGMLENSANVRGVSEDDLRARLLEDAEDLLDENGQLHLDYGARNFVASLLPDMTLSILDTAKNKTYKNLPKPGKNDDLEKAAQAAGTLEKLKNAVKSISVQRIKALQEMLQTGRAFSFDEWKKQYMESAILRTLAGGILWGEYDEKDNLLRPFQVSPNGICMDAEGTEIRLNGDRLISVVDAAQLTPEALETWRGIFWGKKTKAAIRQFEAPAHYVLAEYVETRYMDLVISLGYARKVLGYNPYGDFGNPRIDCNFIHVFAAPTGSYHPESDLKVDTVKIGKKLPVFGKLPCHQKRLWNRDLVRLDSILHPEKKAADIVAEGNAEKVEQLVEMRMITPDNIARMINTAIDKQHAPITAYLMQLKEYWLGDLEDPFAEFSLD